MNRKPHFWEWYEPPRWFPGWLHLLTCTYCRAAQRYLNEHAP